MTQSESMKPEPKELMRYLYAEMSQDQRDELEERFFLDDELFFELADLENNLVDDFVSGKLAASERARFERSLEKFPERRQKIANARALQAFIAEEKSAVAATAAPLSETPTFWENLKDFFTIKSSFLIPAMGSLLIFFFVAGIFLVLDNRRKNDELAQLQNEQNGIENLQGKIADAEKRIAELNNQLENKDEVSDELIKTLGSEQQKIERLQNDLEKAQKESTKPAPTTPKPPAPVIASILLSPTVGSRGGSDGGKMKTASLGANTKKLAVNLSLPDEVKKEEKFSISLNEKPFLQNVSPRISADGKKSISLTIATNNLPEGANKLIVSDSTGKEITRYIFNVDKPTN